MRTFEEVNRLLKEAEKEQTKWNTRVEVLRNERKVILNTLIDQVGVDVA